MADQEIKKSGPKKPNEMSMEQRLLLAFGLMGLVLFTSQYFYKPADPQKSIQTVTPAKPTQAEKPAAPAPLAAPGEAMAAGSIAASNDQTFRISTKLYDIVFGNRGAVIQSWQLKQYRDHKGKPLELVNKEALTKTGYPFSYAWDGQKPSFELNHALFVGKLTPDGKGIDFEYSNGRTAAKKSLRFKDDSYLAQVSSEVRENGTGIPHLLTWRGGFGDRTVAAAAATQKTLYYDTSANKLVENEADVAKNGPSTNSGTYSFAGIEDTYFAAVFVPKDRQSVKIQTTRDYVVLNATENKDEEPVIGAAVGGDARNEFSLFVGPKDVDLLAQVDKKLEGVVDFGWFSFLAKPLFTALNWLNDNYIHNYGWSIVILTILINLTLLPLKLTGMKSMKKMSALKPEIDAINERYKSIKLTDPRKSQQQQEVMELYKKHGVNPLNMGCMPLLLQIPFFFAFYKVLSMAIELRGSDWLWIRDLSQYDPLYVLPVVMVATQFLLQKMTPATPGTDPMQQKMLMFMPLFMGFIFIKASAGLVLYWLTGNLVGILQQAFINRSTAAPAAATAVINVKPVRKTTRK